MCWRGYSLYDCNTEFRFFWMNSKLAETDALKPASQYHRYRFSVLPVYECDVGGLQAAYSAPVPFTRDGIIFINRYSRVLFPKHLFVGEMNHSARYDLAVVCKILIWKFVQICIACIAGTPIMFLEVLLLVYCGKIPYVANTLWIQTVKATSLNINRLASSSLQLVN